ncbi:rhamnose mutarotase [Calocera cornea HHB12733]|uniref:Rhamnose mutarotase n=1 Tax=Calocera cornea HHB12733 TaxID=1353952 RepID=A0A165CEX8_9BASI|nr:rhamnose mutarotase [Calocera cornea HHB12733]
MADCAPETKTSEGKRVCQVIKLRKEHAEEYKRIHASVWPGVLAALRRAHIVDYSIHLLSSPPYPSLPGEELAGLLIATFKYVGSNWEGDMRAVAEDEETRRWWGVTDGMQASFVKGAEGSEAGEWWTDCEEVFRFEG